VHLTNEGLRIELIEKRSSLFFGTGSAKLNPRTVRLLQVIAHELRDLKNPIVVEGHTDSRPLNGANGYSNWELSGDRANAARRAMEEHGLRKGQIIGFRGFADRKLLRKDDPTHFSNRRVSILVAYPGGPEESSPEESEPKEHPVAEHDTAERGAAEHTAH
jgi:chemotaxis protein MotB